MKKEFFSRLLNETLHRMNISYVDYLYIRFKNRDLSHKVIFTASLSTLALNAQNSTELNIIQKDSQIAPPPIKITYQENLNNRYIIKDKKINTNACKKNSLISLQAENISSKEPFVVQREQFTDWNDLTVNKQLPLNDIWFKSIRLLTCISLQIRNFHKHLLQSIES